MKSWHPEPIHCAECDLRAYNRRRSALLWLIWGTVSFLIGAALACILS